LTRSPCGRENGRYLRTADGRCRRKAAIEVGGKRPLATTPKFTPTPQIGDGAVQRTAVPILKRSMNLRKSVLALSCALVIGATFRHLAANGAGEVAQPHVQCGRRRHLQRCAIRIATQTGRTLGQGRPRFTPWRTPTAFRSPGSLRQFDAFCLANAFSSGCPLRRHAWSCASVLVTRRARLAFALDPRHPTDGPSRAIRPPR
jgi:hypothetical protein